MVALWYSWELGYKSPGDSALKIQYNCMPEAWYFICWLNHVIFWSVVINCGFKYYIHETAGINVPNDHTQSQLNGRLLLMISKESTLCITANWCLFSCRRESSNIITAGRNNYWVWSRGFSPGDGEGGEVGELRRWIASFTLVCEWVISRDIRQSGQTRPHRRTPALTTE